LAWPDGQRVTMSEDADRLLLLVEAAEKIDNNLSVLPVAIQLLYDEQYKMLIQEIAKKAKN
jgi:hypothetical protein